MTASGLMAGDAGIRTPLWSDLTDMDTAPSPAGHACELRPDTGTGRRDRLAWEAGGLAEADADIAAGRLVGAAVVRTWVESIDTGHELPVPYSGF
jgi:hypothetical protein